MSNFTVVDLIGSFCGVFLFVPLMIPLGYVAGWLSGAFEFRKLSVPWRILISVPLSIALGPILSYWLGSLFNWFAVWSLYALSLVLFLALLCGARGHENARKWLSALWQTPRVSWIIAGAWLVIALFSLADLQLGDRLYFSATVYDHSVRTAITDAIGRTGVRPENPFYYLGSPVPLRYHYFWFIACSLVDRLGDHVVNARQAIIASVVWSGWALAAMVPLFLRFVFGMTGNVLRRAAVVALALTIVTGLDILPTVYYWTRGIVYPDMEWWNDQITSWWGSGLWVPHHLAALVIGLTALLLLWDAASEPASRARIAQATLAGIALATMIGTSIYVALVFAVFLSLWTVATWLLRHRRHTAVLVIGGAVAVLLVIPYLLTLAHSSAGGGDAGRSLSFVRPTVRHFAPLDHWQSRHPISRMESDILRLLVLPLNYFLELGVFLVAAYLYLLRRWRTRSWDLHVTFTTLLMATSVVICTFFHSSVIVNNDLGTRGFLPAQFVFLLWTADLLTARPQSSLAGKHVSTWFRSPLWAPLILLGALGTIYELGFLRFEGLLADHGVVPLYFSPDRQLGRRTYALRRAYDSLREVLPPDAVIQNNPAWKYSDYFYGLYSHFQTAAYDPDCGATFGGSKTKCEQIYPQIASVFSDKHNLTADQVAGLSKRLSVNAMLIKDLDETWKDHQSWAWRIAPAIANDYVRIYLFSPAMSRASNLRHRFNAPIILGQF